MSSCRLAALAVISAAAVACSGCSVVKHAAAPNGQPILPAKATLPVGASSYLGVYEADEPSSYSQIDTFAQNVGRKPNIALYFSGWGEAFHWHFATTAWTGGAITLVQINPYRISLVKIAAGDYDGYLARYADQVRAFAHPVIIGFAHEMNGGWYPWGDSSVSPVIWIAAWRHLVAVFRRNGADNVTWLWTINALGKGYFLSEQVVAGF